jgi:hypothetical protein
MLLPAAAALVGMLAFLRLVPAAMPFALLGLAGYAWRSPRAAIEALTVLFVVLNLNPGLFPSQGQGASLRWLVLLSAFGRAVWDGLLLDRPWPVRVLAPVFLFSGTVIVLAVAGSRIPEVSVFKGVAFTLGVTAVLSGMLRTADAGYWRSWFLTVFLVVLAVSLPLYVLPVGFWSNGRGFQGILVHPQTLGPALAPVVAWLLVRTLFQGDRSPAVLGGLAAGVFAVIATESRTAALMLVGGLGAAGLVALRRGAFRLPGWSPTAILFAAVALVGLLVISASSLRERAAGFLLKRVDATSTSSTEIRARMISRQWENFRAHPFTGIGFGLPSDAAEWSRVSTGFLGLPTGYTSEKGFLPTSVLEETGAIGALLIVFVLAALMRPVFREGPLPAVALLTASLLANAGEMVFFSFGGTGLMLWLLIGLAHAESGHT